MEARRNEVGEVPHGPKAWNVLGAVDLIAVTNGNNKGPKGAAKRKTSPRGEHNVGEELDTEKDQAVETGKRQQHVTSAERQDI